MTDADNPKPEFDRSVIDAVEATEPPPVEQKEPEAEPRPEMQRPAPAPLRDPQPPKRRGVFFPAVLGGALAAAGGFAASHYDLLTLRPPADTSAIAAQLASQAADAAALRLAVDDLAARPVAEAGLADRLLQVEQALAAVATPDLSGIEQRLSDMEARLSGIAALPADGTGASPAAMAALATLQAEVAALKSAGANMGDDMTKLAAEAEARLAEAEAQATALKAEAEDIARKARQSAAIGRIRAALESGAPFGAALGDLGAVEVPAVLADSATTGLPTLASLAAGFPDAARAALDASLRANMGESWADRVGSFLRSQTGARSLTPREGPDPDAVLSRAEAALGAGDLQTALAEIGGLPEVGQLAMAPWVAEADRRVAADAAVQALDASLGQ